MLRSRVLPPCLFLGLTQLLVLLALDPHALSHETEDWASEGKRASGSWQDEVKRFCMAIGSCHILSRRRGSDLAQAHNANDTRAISGECVALLVSCPTLPVIAPVWAHINVCHTCSRSVLRRLFLDLSRGCKEPGPGRKSVSLVDGTRALTVLGQLAVSRHVVEAVWEWYVGPRAKCLRGAPAARSKLRALRQKLDARQVSNHGMCFAVLFLCFDDDGSSV